MNDQTSPISMPVNVARLPQRGMPVVLEPDAEQRQALAQIHGLDSIVSFRADLEVTHWRRHGVRVEGRISAIVGQTCVVTLEPMENAIDEEIDAVFLPEASKLGREGFGQGGEIVLDPEGEDSPETFSGDWIDVGALAEEFFGLAIDPYPRKAEATQAEPTEKESSERAEGNLAEKLRAALGRKED